MKDIDEIRRDNIRLIEQECGGPAAAANRIGMSHTQFTNLRNGAKDSKTGKPRGMRKDTARRIEEALNKPLGWLDIDHSQSPAIELSPHDKSGAHEITKRFLSAPKAKQEVIEFLLLTSGEPLPGWVDGDARAYVDSLESKAEKWIENRKPQNKASA
ncbi:hypothetical protein QLL80_004388 [Yersinia enterocolitica]|nr:hypothetical protein [Yersinia enterocolitica]